MILSRPTAAACATAIFVIWPGPLRSQTPTTQRQPLEVGQDRAGLLAARDTAAGDRIQSWAIRGRRGQAMVVDLISTAFDPQLMIVGPGMQPVADDDGGGACNARIAFTPTEDGIFWALVESAESSGSGAFTLRVSRSAGPTAPGSCGGGPSEAKFSAAELLAVPAAGTLAIGGEVRGELTSRDHDLGEGQAVAYDLTARRGATATIDLISRDFDAFVAVTGPGLERPLDDDDSGGQCNARVTLTFPGDGVYHVVVTSASSGETGGFVLRASATAAPVADTECDGPDQPPGHDMSVRVSPDELAQLHVQGTIAVGDDIAGELTDDTPTIVDGTHALVWTIAGQRGKTVVIDMISDAFDAYLMLSGPGIGEPMTDDDSGGGCNARLSITFPEDGTYRVVANTVDRGATGRFRLRASAEAGPVAKGTCDSR